MASLDYSHFDDALISKNLPILDSFYSSDMDTSLDLGLHDALSLSPLSESSIHPELYSAMPSVPDSPLTDSDAERSPSPSPIDIYLAPSVAPSPTLAPQFPSVAPSLAGASSMTLPPLSLDSPKAAPSKSSKRDRRKRSMSQVSSDSEDGCFSIDLSKVGHLAPDEINGLIREAELKKKRLARKAELARLSRRKKKERLSELEDEVADLKERIRQFEAGELIPPRVMTQIQQLQLLAGIGPVQCDPQPAPAMPAPAPARVDSFNSIAKTDSSSSIATMLSDDFPESDSEVEEEVVLSSEPAAKRARFDEPVVVMEMPSIMPQHFAAPAPAPQEDDQNLANGFFSAFLKLLSEDPTKKAALAGIFKP